MAKPKAPRETTEQRQQRARAERDNITAMQESLGVRTRMFQRIKSPRISIATGRSAGAYSLAR
jgi:hypothetical protein